ncbi:MAG: hypothetical protein NE327_19365 [Lentisphaeraceae bacterium]|nr:hypothetical protein [Lentisphaeraceae bacterium]
MKTIKILGRGSKQYKTYSWPYEVGLNYGNDNIPIYLGEGIGHGSAGGFFTLRTLLEEQWEEHLKLCDCEKLKEIALEEKQNKQKFSAEEIYKKWNKKN